MLLYLYFCDLLRETGERCSDHNFFILHPVHNASSGGQSAWSEGSLLIIMIVDCVSSRGPMVSYTSFIHLIIYFALNEWQVCNDTIHETKENLNEKNDAHT